MKTKAVYHRLLAAKANHQKKLVVLIDPDKVTPESLIRTLDISVRSGVDYFFIGGSLLISDTMSECIDVMKSCTDIPVIIFPGNASQIYPNADAILLLSLISGRNPDLLIGQHVAAASVLCESALEIISTGYMLIDGGITTSVSYMSNTLPIPYDKDEIAMSTAMAGEMLGMKLLYLEAGSGALNSVSESMINRVSENIEVPVIVGGGISSPEIAKSLCNAGADIIVIGTASEKNPDLIPEFSQAVHSTARQLRGSGN